MIFFFFFKKFLGPLRIFRSEVTGLGSVSCREPDPCISECHELWVALSQEDVRQEESDLSCPALSCLAVYIRVLVELWGRLSVFCIFCVLGCVTLCTGVVFQLCVFWDFVSMSRRTKLLIISEMSRMRSDEETVTYTHWRSLGLKVTWQKCGEKSIVTF